MSRCFWRFFVFALLEIVIHSFQNFVFALYGDNSSNNNSEMQQVQNPENPLEEEKEIKSNVRSYVDSLLRINSHVDPAYKNPITREEMKKQNVGEQISKLREDIDSLQKVLANGNYVGDSSKLSGQENEASKKSATPKRRKRRRSNRSSSGGYPHGIYTVKDVYRPNAYGYSGETERSFHGNSEYKIKSYGAEGGGSCGQGRSCPKTKSSKRKGQSGGSGEPAPFRSTPGCETGCTAN
jgi:hypothetical protein